jgi:hypothetical protein
MSYPTLLLVSISDHNTLQIAMQSVPASFGVFFWCGWKNLSRLISLPIRRPMELRWMVATCDLFVEHYVFGN